MRALHQVAASQLGVGVWYQKGFEQNGIAFTSPNEDEIFETLGAQCANCHTIVWITGRSDPILNEEVPQYAKHGGPAYRKYIKDNLKRFLRSLPSCPHCHQQAYDLFINNIVIPRYQNGESYSLETDQGVNEEMSAKVKDIAIWWYGDETEAKRLNLHFL
ncbi:hypothetical protein [Acinetobacter gerneri]|uniref:Uncharacterized protein n=1 Tax=Acinetobacter gerneri DSM 14967 = CIP 107464 = MTCC 9824 TaxID=1120926 RepID=N8ZNA1_9GAMM|nr:hypothetical protein [Acinetobacter gerneri]ENV32980.1 hypothetical protein F960_02702 [Acinetobacter gerneri DSM 14967 = CIP 107464 = MTCC 9824]